MLHLKWSLMLLISGVGSESTLSHSSENWGFRFEEGVGNFFGVGGVVDFIFGWVGEIRVLVVAGVFVNAAVGDRVRGCCTCAVLRG